MSEFCQSCCICPTQCRAICEAAVSFGSVPLSPLHLLEVWLTILTAHIGAGLIRFCSVCLPGVGLVPKWIVSKKRSCSPTGGLYAVSLFAAYDTACESRCAKHTRTRHVMRSTHRVRYRNAGYTSLCCIPFLMRAVTPAVRRKPVAQEPK